MTSPDPGVRAVPDALAYLAGNWSVERELYAGEHVGHFSGRAEFRTDDADDGWLHVEEGVMEWDGAQRDASRTLRMTPLPDGSAEVSFADGRPFHTLDLRRGHWTAVHQCAADRYEGTFTVLSPDEWHLRWEVHGPAKDQLLVSVYRRATT
ncbi:DUF6314 family protein [Streptomyces sp. NPDC053560]|uniref:DUF6314 family protein n=1 Tax=Streptomyces sp. NPDC053560 TaxID=3365711 RepID=UPI0037D38839